MSHRLKAPSSIRTRFLLVVLLGAVLPLGLIGVWVTRSVVRAGEELLRSELDQSLQKMANAIDDRWSYRQGDLALLAANDVAQRLVAPDTPPLSTADSAYLGQLFTTLSQSIPSFEYRDASGSVRWQTPAVPPDTAAVSGQRGQPQAPSQTLTITLPVRTSPGNPPLGTMVARVSLASLMPTDTSLRLPNGARLQIRQRDGHLDLLPVFAADTLLTHDRFAVGDIDWLGVRRSLAGPDIDVFLAAPLGAYVAPFEHAAQTGLLTVAIVALLALLFTAVLITRLTRSLKQLAIAADAVASGNLEQHADAQGNDEVARVGTAFNSMVDNLRRTLSELAKRQALAAVGEYAASLSHEVRNGLTAVRVDLQRAEEKADATAPERPLIGRALDNVKRLESTVTASLRAARGDTTPRRRIDLRPVLRSAVQSAEVAFGERAAAVSPPPHGAPVWVLGDTVALEQLFLNLLLNSAQAVGRGGRAEIAIDIDEPNVRISVTDTGTGISAENLERMQDPFFSTKPDGNGLGLSIARRIAAAHGGTLRIESTVGTGTLVEVRLPLAMAPGRPS